MLEVIQREFRRSKLSINALSKRTGLPYASCHGMMTRKSYDASLATVQEVPRSIYRPSASVPWR